MNWALRKKEYVLFSATVLIFVALHLFGVNLPYHQDEYKWVFYSHPELTLPGTVPHPPLTEFIYTRLGPVLGDNNFRFIPFAFGFVNLLLIFWLSKIIFNSTRSALWAVLLFTISYYSLLASLMVDVDGAIMPFFLLVLSIGYFKLKASGWNDYRWMSLIFIGGIGGFLIKVSAILPLIAFALDFAVEKNVFSDKKRLMKYVLFIVVAIVLLSLVLLLAKFVFPFFNLEYSMKYWEHFANSSSFFSRGWFQTFIQVVKSTLYLSPLLLMPLFFMDREIFSKTRPFFIFVFAGLVFYIVVFDFSLGALDRYLQFLIIPLCIIAGAIYSKYFANVRLGKKSVISLALVGVVVFFVQFIYQVTPPLYPKTEWLSRLLSLKWNFLYPFSGGSGPMAFYVSFAFIALIWIFVVALVGLYWRRDGHKTLVLVGILIFGILYNGVFIEEYLSGQINGSSSALLHNAVTFIKNNKDIQKVTVYNDNGGFDIEQIGKYRKRLYIDPKFDVGQKIITLNQYKEHYLVIDIPHIDPSTVYAKYFSSCAVVYNEISKKISATVYDCRNAPDIKL